MIKKAKSLTNNSIISENRSNDYTRILTDAPLSDLGNAECFAALYKDEFRYVKESGSWMHWDGNVWRVDNERAFRTVGEVARMRREAAATLDKPHKEVSEIFNWALKSEGTKFIKNTLEAASKLEEFSTSINQFDANPYLLGVKNGVIDLETGKFKQARPEDYITMQSKAVHDKNATAPLFEKFLSEVYPDKDVRNWIQKLIGYSLTGSTKEQSLTMLLGSGSNGKGALFRVMQELLGDYMDVLPFSTFDASNKNDFSHDLADLKGVRLVLISETEQDRYLAEAKLKQVTGEDAIKARFLYQKFFTYRPQFKIIMAFNHKPKIRGRDDGIWRRLNVVPHTQSFLDPKNARDARKIKRLESEKKSWLKKDKDLEGKLNAELSGILNFAIEGLKMWQSEGLGAVPQAMAEANEEYEKEQDIFGQWMEESLVFGSGKASSKPMWESYRDWCEENNHHGLGSGRFYAELKDRLLESGCTLDRSSGKGSMYVGVSMKEEDSPLEQDETEQSADVLSFPSKSKRMAA